MTTAGRRLKEVTLDDVAAEVGVSAATVSRVLSRPDLVRTETARRVQDAVEALGYRQPAETHRRGQLDAVAVMTFSVAGTFLWSLFAAIQDEARANGLEVILLDAEDHPSFERPKIQGVLRVVSGVIMVSPRAPEASILQIAKQRPTVVLNRPVRGVTCILQDTSEGMRQAVDHLADLGHREVSYLATIPVTGMNAARQAAIERRCLERSMGFRVIDASPVAHGMGELAFEAWRWRPSSAVIAFHDDSATEFLMAAARAGLRVPDDVSVVGIDDVPLSAHLHPRLTSVAVGTQIQGSSAVQQVLMLLQRVPPKRPPLVPLHLVIRDSTGPAPP